MRAIVECSSDAIFITDFDSARFVEVNSRACQLFGFDEEELRGMTGRQLHALEDAANVDAISRELIENGSVERPAVRLRRKDGSLFWAELRSSSYRVQDRKLYVTFIRDVSARVCREAEIGEAYRILKEKEAQLIRSSRLAAIGQLAAGIGHEVSNPAASVLINLELLKEDLVELEAAFDARDSENSETEQPSEAARKAERAAKQRDRFLGEAQESVAESLEAIARIVAMVRGLRGFARIDEEDVSLVDVNDVVQAACGLVRHQIRHAAIVQSELKATRRFPGERGQLVQVLVNLMLNASHAIEEGGGGMIKVLTSDEGEGVLVRVEDDGPGVPPDLAERIFEPFFTTKEPDRGTGLGLSLCADIVRQHRGTLDLQSLERGACFEIFLPFATGLRPSEHPARAAETRGGRILVIDDEVSLVRAYRRFLGRRHEVVAAYGGEEALQVLAMDSDFDLVLCDLMMPGIDGMAVYEWIKANLSALLPRVVFCSGGPTGQRFKRFLNEPGVTFAEKPIAQDALNRWLAQSPRRRVTLRPVP